MADSGFLSLIIRSKNLEPGTGRNYVLPRPSPARTPRELEPRALPFAFTATRRSPLSPRNLYFGLFFASLYPSQLSSRTDPPRTKPKNNPRPKSGCFDPSQNFFHNRRSSLRKHPSRFIRTRHGGRLLSCALLGTLASSLNPHICKSFWGDSQLCPIEPGGW